MTFEETTSGSTIAPQAQWSEGTRMVGRELWEELRRTRLPARAGSKISGLSV